MFKTQILMFANLIQMLNSMHAEAIHVQVIKLDLLLIAFERFLSHKLTTTTVSLAFVLDKAPLDLKSICISQHPAMRHVFHPHLEIGSEQ